MLSVVASFPPGWLIKNRFTMKPIRILIVEDDAGMLAALEAAYLRIFSSRSYQPAIERASTVEEAIQLAKTAAANPYDLVSLDVDLGDRVLTGLDVLATLKRFHSAWMVVLLTGVETSTTVDQTMGTAKGSELRKQLRRDAYASFPNERLLVIEKPPLASQKLLADRLLQIALVYEEVGRLRYVFRPIEVVSLKRVSVPKRTKGAKKRSFIETTALHWQIRFNCGEIRTLPDGAGFRTLHYLLSQDRNRSITPEEALVNEPKAEKGSASAPAVGTDSLAACFEAQGIDWKNCSSEEKERLIRAALPVLKMRRYTELREIQDEDDLTPTEEDELEGIKEEFGALAGPAENVYRLLKTGGEVDRNARRKTIEIEEVCEAGLHHEGGNYDRLGKGRRGLDSPAAQLFRTRKKRVQDCLRENGFADFAQHIEDFVQSTGANWSYNPPEGVEWTT